jgi:hypothetical protein
MMKGNANGYVLEPQMPKAVRTKKPHSRFLQRQMPESSPNGLV